MPAVLDPHNYAASLDRPAPAITPNVSPLLREMPRLLEYRADADPDAEFIPKTIAGFCFGAMVFGFCLNLGEEIFTKGTHSHAEIVNTMVTRFAFMLGITGVAASLLLVGLKVRADHSAVDLFSKHWLNSICTGSFYALLVWGPWFLIENNWATMVNRFVAAAIWMSFMAFPAIAAKWTIGPQKTLGDHA